MKTIKKFKAPTYPSMYDIKQVGILFVLGLGVIAASLVLLMS
jgi:hypothetical protein